VQHEEQTEELEVPQPPRRKSIVLASAALVLLSMVIIVALFVLGITHTGYGRSYNAIPAIPDEF